MKMVWHHNELVEAKFALGAVFIKDADKKLGRAVGLKEITLSCNRRSYEERTRASGDVFRTCVSNRNGHEQRLKPAPFCVFSARLKPCPDTNLTNSRVLAVTAVTMSCGNGSVLGARKGKQS